jgi:hypothetical protein
MRVLMVLCFLFTLPLLAAIGHDVYYAYQQNPAAIIQAFQFSDLGWLWLTYAGDSYHSVRDMIDPGLWKKFIGPVLEQKSIVVAAVPALICYVLFFTFKIFKPFLARLRLMPRRRLRPEPGNDAAVRKRARALLKEDDDLPKKRTIKYNRK